jgi:hypothetical protein
MYDLYAAANVGQVPSPTLRATMGR